MDNASTVILACSSLEEYVDEAQRRVGTELPVIYLDRIYHRDPAEMRSHIESALASLPDSVETVLVAMGFCGGSWEGVASRFRLVLPRIDDCVSLLLQTGDEPVSDLKLPRSLYVRAKEPSAESFKAIFDRMTKDRDEETRRRYHEDWKRCYDRIVIIDTGINDCRREDYAATVQKDADWLEAKLEYTGGGLHLLEKLLRGEWDGQFFILEPTGAVRRNDILI